LRIAVEPRCQVPGPALASKGSRVPDRGDVEIVTALMPGPDSVVGDRFQRNEMRWSEPVSHS
jgi:hypothetical protein